MLFMCSVALLPLDSHISTYKYKLVDPTLCVKLSLRPHYAHICAYARLINEGPDTDEEENMLTLKSKHYEYNTVHIQTCICI